MARHLLAAGYQLTVHNRTRERELPLAELGAARAASPAEAARDAEAILTCLSDTPDVEAVIFGEEGVAAGLAEGGLLVDCSNTPVAPCVQARNKVNAGDVIVTFLASGDPFGRG